MERYAIPKHLDDPELIGLWTLDEFLVMIIPFVSGIMFQHIVLGLLAAIGFWLSYRKIRAGRSMSWILHFGYWYLPGEFFGLKSFPPSHLRVLAG
jgi:conjugal transfer pilus assembly protein TraL